MKSFPLLHLDSGDGNPLRCCSEFCDSSTDSGTICGNTADAVCNHCGPRCLSCLAAVPCDGGERHDIYTPEIDENHHPVTATLAAMAARRITVECGVERLKAMSASQNIIEAVQRIESGNGSYSDYLPAGFQIAGLA